MLQNLKETLQNVYEYIMFRLFMCPLVSQPEIYNSGTLQSGSTSYFVLNLIGEGCYGKVARCQNLQTKEEVAVKILKPDSAEDIKQEVRSLF